MSSHLRFEEFPNIAKLPITNSRSFAFFLIGGESNRNLSSNLNCKMSLTLALWFNQCARKSQTLSPFLPKLSPSRVASYFHFHLRSNYHPNSFPFFQVSDGDCNLGRRGTRVPRRRARDRPFSRGILHYHRAQPDTPRSNTLTSAASAAAQLLPLPLLQLQSPLASSLVTLPGTGGVGGVKQKCILYHFPKVTRWNV